MNTSSPGETPKGISKLAALTQDEVNALRSIGVIAENWYAVSSDKTQKPIAIFYNEEYAKMYRNQFSVTSIIEPWPMVIKDYRKP